MMMRTDKITVFCIVLGFVFGGFVPISAQKAQKYTISGYVADKGSGERLIGANVFDRKSGLGTVTNTYGFFSITLSSDTVRLTVTYLGFNPQLETFILVEDKKLNYRLDEANSLKEVVITAERYERIEERAQMGRIDVPIEQIKSIPALLGEKDVLKALQLLPGVSAGGEGQSGIYVRGGGPDQNLILLDGVPVYNASHLFGFFSVFNTDAIKDVTLTKGGFPARYGGRLSSVIEINMKEGNDQEYHGEGAVGIIASRLTVEGPIKKGVSSFILSGRRTYIDILAQPFIKASLKSNGQEGKFGYFFHDVNAKVNYKFGDRDRVFLSFYGGKDKFYADIGEPDQGNGSSFSSSNGIGWGNVTSALRWNHLLTKQIFANTTLTYSRYNFNTKAAAVDKFRSNNKPQESSFYLSYFSGIDDIAAKVDFDYSPSPNHAVKFGTSIIHHTFHPGVFDTEIKSTEDNFRLDTLLGQADVNAQEYAFYAEDDWKVGARLRINAGLHYGGFFTQNGKHYGSLQPRINTRYFLGKGWALKTAFSTMQQNILLLSNESIGLPTDLWLPATDIVKPQTSWQVGTGVAKTLGQDYEFSVEAYYKKMNNVIAFKEGASFFSFTNWETRVTQGEGDSYGAEFFVQKKTGRFSGWVGYTLSWSNRQFELINFGRKYPYRYDRRHDFEIVGSYKISKRVQLAGTWVFSTGNVVTLGTSKIYTPYEYYTNINTNVTERNNYRLAPYHRFDIGIDFTKQKKRHQRTWSWGAYNAYSRANPFFLYLSNEYNYDPTTGQGTRKTVLKQTALFPIIPYVSYAFKF
jgi:TonB-dependent Receptor Plug Domain/CarboxypepD_reg-like domain/TonB dependent receptor